MNITYKQGRTNRQKARTAGELTYLTRACRNCQDNRRYTATGVCPTCQLDRSRKRHETVNYNQAEWRKNRQRSREQGMTTYHGKPCNTCENTVRYTCNKGCVECHKKLNAKKRQETSPRTRSGDRTLVMIQAARGRAKKKDLEFRLTPADIEIPSHCPVLGIELSWEGDRWNSPSIDRIDNSRGYVPDNVAVISTRANHLKGDGSLEELEKIVEYMRKAA